MTLIVLDATFPASTTESKSDLALSYTVLLVLTVLSTSFFILLSLSSLSYLFLAKPVTEVLILVAFVFAVFLNEERILLTFLPLNLADTPSA